MITLISPSIHPKIPLYKSTPKTQTNEVPSKIEYACVVGGHPNLAGVVATNISSAQSGDPEFQTLSRTSLLICFFASIGSCSHSTERHFTISSVQLRATTK
jgi:hypothetical protein